MVSSPGAVFFDSLIAEISSLYEKAWLRRVSFSRICDSVCCKYCFFAGRMELTKSAVSFEKLRERANWFARMFALCWLFLPEIPFATNVGM